MPAYQSLDYFSFREIWYVTDLLGVTFGPQVHFYARAHFDTTLYCYRHPIVSLVFIFGPVRIDGTRELSYLRYYHRQRAEITEWRSSFEAVS